MTRVGFYVLGSNEPGERLNVAMRLTEKAFQQGHRVFVNARSQAEAQQIDSQLWDLRPASFLPHGLAGSTDAETIAIGWGQDPGAHGDLLINLQLEVPAFFGRFQRVAEVVTQDPESLEALRTSYRFYRDRGYQLEKHDL